MRINRHVSKVPIIPVVNRMWSKLNLAQSAPSAQDANPGVLPELNIFEQASSIRSSRSTAKRTAQAYIALPIRVTWPSRGHLRVDFVRPSAKSSTSLVLQRYEDQVSNGATFAQLLTKPQIGITREHLQSMHLQYKAALVLSPPNRMS